MFPLEVLPVIAVSTATFHTAVRFLVFVLAYRLIEGNLHATVLWAPVILAPAVLLSLGLSWALAAAGVFLRDLNEMIGVALTGSDTSSNVLFGPVQVAAAGQVGLPPVLMAAANSSAGVLGKMLSVQNLAVAAACWLGAGVWLPEDSSRRRTQ